VIKVADTFQFVIKKGPTPGQVIDLKADEVTLGRERSNVLTINDKGLSRFHARLTKTDEGYTLEDLGSTNGTFVNGKVIISPKPLENGDQIGLGENVTLEFRKVNSKSDATEVLPSRSALQEELKKAYKAHAKEHQDLFSRWFEELWNKKNYAITRELVSDGFVAHGAGGQDIKQGPDGVASMVKTWHQAFPDGHMTMDDITTEGEMSAIRMTFRGTHTGEFYGVPASNKKVEVTSIGIDRVVNGKISEGWGELNMLGLMQQIGAIPAPAQGSGPTEVEAAVTPEHVGEAYDALASGDIKLIRKYWADDMVWQVPGHNELSGWYYSRDEFLGFMSKVGEMSDHSFKMELIAGRVMVTGDYSVDLTRNTGRRKDAPDKSMDIEVAHVLRWRDGKIIAGKGAIFGDGSTEYDQFWSRSPFVTPSSPSSH
jgi:steroid delta-isomerase-like uncharacterized protein